MRRSNSKMSPKQLQQQQQPPWLDSVLEITKAAHDNATDPLLWALQLSSDLSAAGVSLPSLHLSEALISHICWSNNTPTAWKFLDKALSLRIVSPMLVIAHLSNRVIPNRRNCPAAYRLYMELVKRYAFSLPSLINGPNYQETMKAINDVLRLYHVYEVQSSEPGIFLVEFIFSIVWELLDASLDDESLLELTPEKKSRWPIRSEDMDVDYHDSFEGKKMEPHKVLCQMNTVMAVEIIGEFIQNKITSRILYLCRRNMPKQWECFIQNLRLLAANSSLLRNSKHVSPEGLLKLTSDTRQVLSRECKPNSSNFHLLTAKSPLPDIGNSRCNVQSVLWCPIELYLEDAMDGSQVRASSAAETLTGLVKGLQALNQTNWLDTFLGLWTTALRLVQRERNSTEGPVPLLDTCLCMLLSITPLAIVNIIEDEEIKLVNEPKQTSTGQRKDTNPQGKCRQALVSCLQRLGDFEGLLDPPPPVSSLANQAAAKAMLFLSGITASSGHLDSLSMNETPLNCSGDLRHLIVETCIARNILDTSAYLWPGYVKGHCNQIPRNIPGQQPGWSSLMKGLPLTPPMVSALVSTPATSLAEIERLYEIAIGGTDDEKLSAATIFCGASLCRGWNIQEHATLLIIRLLSPPVPKDFSGSESHLITYAPFLNILLVGISPVDCMHIVSLHGLVPQLAAALMPICEVFGSYTPNMSWKLNTGEEITSHAVFSNAFTLLLKLWKSNQPPLECVMGEVSPVGSHITPEYLLMVYNSQLSSYDNPSKNELKINKPSRFSYPSSRDVIIMDSFPNLKRWYRKHQECIASVLSCLVPGDPVHHVVEALLNKMFKKINRGGQTGTSTTSGSSSSSSASGTDDYSLGLKIPGWDILEAVPFVLDAALTACAHGKVSPRELTTGLKDLADFLPASLGTIVGYFSAEVTRGLWKPAVMNGTDWPSPAVNLAGVEQQVRKILAATGVHVPGLAAGGSSPLELPLPLAALLSLTITYKLDKVADRYLSLVGRAMCDLGVSCPWPSMPIIVALWTQKAKRWNDFLVFAAAQTVFHHNIDTVVQLIRVCFTTVLGLKSASVASNGGVGSLLGHGFGSHAPGGISAIAPGILYFWIHRAVRNTVFLTEQIVSLLMQSVKDIANAGLPPDKMEKLKKTKYSTKYGHLNSNAAMIRVKTAGSLAASLVWLTGGLGSVQSLIKEILPSWFISDHNNDNSESHSSGVVDMLGGYALAYFTVISGIFGWGLDSSSTSSKRRPTFLGKHMEFLASALDGKISLGCKQGTWRAYVTGFFSLMVSCTPAWMEEVNVDVVKRIAKGLKELNEEELGLAVVGISGISAMGAAAEMIIEAGC